MEALKELQLLATKDEEKDLVDQFEDSHNCKGITIVCANQSSIRQVMMYEKSYFFYNI